jgi:diguanylate cyclase (GGDEF)-like protein
MEKEKEQDILGYIIEITEQRDAELLEESLARTIYELFDAEKVFFCRTKNESPFPHHLISIGSEGQKTCKSENAIHEALGGSEDLLSEVIKTRNYVSAVSGTFSLHAYPVFLGARIVGFLAVSGARQTHPDHSLVTGLLRIYHNYLLLLSENQHDKLTGLLNRATFDAQIMKIIDYKKQLGYPEEPPDSKRHTMDAMSKFWLGIFDIDDFKKINDNFGHVYGDEVLILLARIMSKSFRSDDLLFRFGGEEFVAIIRSCCEEDAFIAFDRFRSSVEHYAFPRVGTITVSVGIVQITESEVPTAFVGHADQALYFAKNNGKNRVCMYERLVREGRLKKQIEYGKVELF